MGLVDVVGVARAWRVLWVFIYKKKYVFCGLGGVYLHIYEEKSMLCALAWFKIFFFGFEV